MAKELDWFKRDKHYERTYGWSWFLKLHHELRKSPLDDSHKWSQILQPLADHLVESYQSFLPSLVYPIRVGEHSNTAFGLVFPLEYAQGIMLMIALMAIIIRRLPRIWFGHLTAADQA